MEKYFQKLARAVRERNIQLRIVREYRRALREGSFDFPNSILLPAHCGSGLPERVIELLLARLTFQSEKEILDVGHAYAMQCHRQMISDLPKRKSITGIDIADPSYNTTPYYVRTVKASITNAPFQSNTFDIIWCISALEHFGMDNSGYTKDSVVEGQMAARALCEMVRVLKPEGQLLVTVPYGKSENHGWFRNFDQNSLTELLNSVRSDVLAHKWFFHHLRNSGWALATPEDLVEVSYAEEGNSGAAAIAAVLLTKNKFLGGL